MTGKLRNVLFLCTGNTARSILAEGILRKDGAGQFNAFSAGSKPKGIVNPHALRTLAAHGYPVDSYRSKSWDEFAAADAPRIDIVITVCDSAADETCPVWPGHPLTAHWGIADPASAEGSEAKKVEAFETAFRLLQDRIRAFLALSPDNLDIMQLRAIGRMPGATRTKS